MNDEITELFDDEFLCLAITGDYRSGKTTLMTYLIKYLSDSYDNIYANFDIFGLNNFRKLDKLNEGTLNSIKDNSIVGITEMYKYLNSRRYKDKKQIDLTDGFNELGKREIVLLGDVFKVSFLDVRLRQIFNIHFHANGSLKNLDKKYFSIFDYSLVHDTDELPNLLPYEESNFLIDMKKYFKMFNTKERINKKRVLTNWIEEASQKLIHQSPLDVNQFSIR